MDAIKFVQEQSSVANDLPAFRSGDNISVSYKIVEGDKERIQIFKGDVIKISGFEGYKTFTVRKMSSGVGVERIFPMGNPNIVEIVINKRGKVRRSKLYYLRDLVGKKARIKERKFLKN
ncbi:50S ribosomal protein L19 [Portibacter lacus]|uniref:Large ribosomal subunit protein bL19 n=1 Tax=Portibacter lacus TaxID=1099794 RepID=A0AA37SKF5_9BACT|nr:50S ribosomal protein L19 [Portibacter lacus]GLR16223.1 50S ribosomal protein L19 [Portibacter lacus]